MDNGSAAAYTQAVVTAVYNPPGTNDPDVVSSSTGHVFVAETPETFTYDDDGNLTRDGRFDYTWDAENRLISATTRDDLPADMPRVRVTHQYDHQSRRIATARETWSGAAWQPAGTNRYLYDGWNLVAEVRAAAPANTNLYLWGLDLSGTLQGAGGIGGLLTVRKRLEDGTDIVRNYDFLFDANGNVVQETFRTDGAINAHYEYDPFGTAVIALRVDATDNPFRFSTKWFDNDTGLGYWGFRWYGPGMGRWLSRDPVGEMIELGLYNMVANDCVNCADLVGLQSMGSSVIEKILGEGTRECKWTLFIGHLSEGDDPTGLSELDKWFRNMPDGGYPGGGCGDHKIGFATCGRKWINGVVPPNNRLPMRPIPPEEQDPYPEDAYEKFKRKLRDYRHIPDKNTTPPPSRDDLTAGTGGWPFGYKEYWHTLSAAAAQCKLPGNCCKSVIVTVNCGPGVEEDFDTALKRSANETIRWMIGGPLVNPCRERKVIRCDGSP